MCECSNGERNVVTDNDIAQAAVVNDPVLCGVECALHDAEVECLIIRDADPGVDHHENLVLLAAGDSVHLLLDWTGVGVDEDVDEWARLGFVGVTWYAVVLRVAHSGAPLCALSYRSQDAVLMIM